ncbi:hypothetical protein RJ640_018725, partial [Escallonia rubra]
GIVSCLRNRTCSKEWHSFHINCGGTQVIGDEKPRYEYEDDTLDLGGPSKFFQSVSNWGFSSTGHFLDNNSVNSYIIESSTSVLLGNNPDLYKDARLSPLSLTYYGYCLSDGSYKVNLHFAEIVFTDDKTYKSLGRRVFDIYIQFNIIYTFVFRSFSKPPSENGNSISAGIVVGIVVGIAFAIFLLLGVLWWKGCLPCKDTKELAESWHSIATLRLCLHKVLNPMLLELWFAIFSVQARQLTRYLRQI